MAEDARRYWRKYFLVSLDWQLYLSFLQVIATEAARTSSSSGLVVGTDPVSATPLFDISGFSACGLQPSCPPAHTPTMIDAPNHEDNMGWSGWEKFRNLSPNDKTNLQEQT
jgi:hypothetical protein